MTSMATFDGSSEVSMSRNQLVFITVIWGASGCVEPNGYAPPAPFNSETEVAIGFDRQAVAVGWDADGVAYTRAIPTAFPALVVAGVNSVGTIAYTTLEALDATNQLGRRPVSLTQAFELTLDDLVPTGVLVTEDMFGDVTIISRPDEIVVSGAWSPTDPSLLAYGVTGHDSTKIVVVDTDTGLVLAEIKDDLMPDTILWDDSGSTLVYQRNAALEFGLTEDILAKNLQSAGIEFEHLPMPFRFTGWNLEQGQERFDLEADDLSVLGGRVKSDFTDQAMSIELATGTLYLTDPVGGDDPVFIKQDEHGDDVQVNIKMEQIRGRHPLGVVYVNSKADRLELHAFNGLGLWADSWLGASADEPDGEDFDIPIMSAVAVTYYIPNPSGSKTIFTQVGYDYGGGCAVSSHYNGSGMDYAIDIQLPLSPSTFDKIIASATGGTFSFQSTGTYNSSDPVGCADYKAIDPATGKVPAWNYVVLSHADGYYTSYGHFEKTNFKVVTPACLAVSAGCWLGDEGHTGYTCCNKFGAEFGSTQSCGDHLHFQRQSTSVPATSSVSVSFVEDSSLTSADCYVNKTPVKASLVCVL